MRDGGDCVILFGTRHGTRLYRAYQRFAFARERAH